MPLARGKDILLAVQNDDQSFSTLGGLRTKAFSLSSGTVEVTHAESAGWRELLPCGGIRQASVSGNGVFLNDAAGARARDLFFSHVHVIWRLTIPGVGQLEGPFQITNLDYAGEFRGEATFSVTLASAGEITFVPEAV